MSRSVSFASASSATCPGLKLPSYAKAELAGRPLETYPRPGQYFDDDTEGYFPLPDDISKKIGKKRRRSSSAASGGGMDHLASIMDEFVIPNKDKDWLDLQEIKDLENQEREDKTWNAAYKYVPCFERNTETKPLDVGKKLKLFKNGKNCGEEAGKGRKFTWTRAHLLIARKPSYDTSSDSVDPEQKKFFEAAYQVCKSSFFYHCSRPGTSEGIGGGYFKEAWGLSTSIGLLISDCGKQTSTEDCGFIVLGFCLLRDYSGVVDYKFQRQKSFLSDAIPMSANVDFPEYAMYVDVVCSKISTAQNLMKLFTQPSKRPDQKWKRVLFGEDAVGKPHYVLLRAIPSVYTYYPIMYKFIRSMDNVMMHPIFKVRQDDIINMLRSSENPELVMLREQPFHSIATRMFGIDDVANGWRVVDAKRGPSKLHVYRLTKEFVNFIKQNNLAAAALKVFVPTKYVCGDSDSNGYLYGLYVS
jgi:hypothetical protein